MDFIRKRSLTCGEAPLSAVQSMAWIDMLFFFVVEGPMILIFLAAFGIDPKFKENKVLSLKNDTAQYVYYFRGSIRGMSELEFLILKKVREGCGRRYSRDFPKLWKAQGQPRLELAYYYFQVSLLVAVLSAILFLIVVPSKTRFGRFVPFLHMMAQMISVTLAFLGVWHLSNQRLCLLEYAWSGVRIQTAISAITILTCTLYKFYEILVIDIFVRLNFRSKEMTSGHTSLSQEPPTKEILLAAAAEIEASADEDDSKRRRADLRMAIFSKPLHNPPPLSQDMIPKDGRVLSAVRK